MSSQDKSIPLPPPEARRSTASSQRARWVEEYLKFLTDRCAELELPVRLAEKRMRLPRLTLPSVYVPLHGVVGLDARSPRGPREGRTPLDRIVETTPGVLVIGESGMGKSTFLRHLASHYVKVGVTVPLLLELADINVFAPQLKTSVTKLPWDTLLRCLVQHLDVVGIEASLDEVRAFIASDAPTIWLLDGFNEISDKNNRKELSDVIRRDRTLWQAARFVVTASDSVIRDGTAPVGGDNDLQEVVIDRFQRDDVYAFFDNFLHTLKPALSEAERRAQWEPVARRVLSVPELEDLLTSPLNLTAIALLHLTEPRDPMETGLPAIRGELLEAVIKWTLRRRSGSGLPEGTEPIDLLTPLGYAMLANDPGPVSKCGIGWAARCVAGGDAFRGDESRAERFLRAAADSGLVLRQAGPGDLKLQESFRDYLASRHLVRRRSQEWKQVLASHLDDPAWRHALHLVAGELLARGTAEVDDFFNWLADLSYALRLEQRLKRVALGGSILRELKAGGYSLSENSPWRNLAFTIMELFRRPLPWIPLRVRYEAGVALGLAGDTRLDDFDSTWATMPGGTAWLGAQGVDRAGTNFDALAAPWEVPVYQCELPEYTIRVFPVTVLEYALFVAAGGYTRDLAEVWDLPALKWIGEQRIQSPLDWGAQLFYPNTPVTGISWYEARAYCNWLSSSRADGYEYRLPREREWEFAARRGVRPGASFPWGSAPALGDEAEANWAGAGLRRKTPVGMFPRSATLDGVADMFGNVEEWCLERWVDFHKTTDWTWDDLTDARHLEDATVLRIVKGGSCIRFSRLMRPSYRSRILAFQRYHTVGFRPVRVARA